MENIFKSVVENDCTVIAESIKEVAERLSFVPGCKICERFLHRYVPPSRRLLHINTFHCKLSVVYPLKDGRKVFCLPCRKKCIKRGITADSRSHYHCPFCLKIYGRKATLEVHFARTCHDSVLRSDLFNRPNKRAVSGKNHHHKKTRQGGDVREIDVVQQHNKLLDITEKKLIEWINQRKSDGQDINITSIQAKACAIFENTKLSLNNKHKRMFQASKAWANNFLARHNISRICSGSRDGMGSADQKNEFFNNPHTSSVESEYKLTMNLIQKVKDCPYLFDTSRNAMQNKDFIYSAWNSIADEIGLSSGNVAEARWKKLEQEYHRRLAPGADHTNEWKYHDHLKFIPHKNYLGQSITQYTPMPTEDVDTPAPPENRDQIVVTIEEDGEKNIEGFGNESGECSISDGAAFPYRKKIYAAELRKIQMEMEIMHEEHVAKMELLQLKRQILMKQLNATT